MSRLSEGPDIGRGAGTLIEMYNKAVRDPATPVERVERLHRLLPKLVQLRESYQPPVKEKRRTVMRDKEVA